jgi:hypothetical protein
VTQSLLIHLPHPYHLNVPQKIPHGDISRITIIFSFQPCIVWLALWWRSESEVGDGGTSKRSQTDRRGVRLAVPLYYPRQQCTCNRMQSSKDSCVIEIDDETAIVMLFKSRHPSHATRAIPHSRVRRACWSFLALLLRRHGEKTITTHTRSIPGVRPMALLKGKRTRKPRSQYVGNYSVVQCLYSDMP